MTALLLAAFFHSSAEVGGLAPVCLTGDMRADWTNHATTAQVCAVDELPAANILASWHRLGVKMLQRIAYDPECPAEFLRRRAGFLAVRDGADGVWLVDEEHYPESWRNALAEARTDVDAVLACKRLAEESLGWKTRDHKVWTEGRRVLWFLDWADFEHENLDTLRLEVLCLIRRLEQLLGKEQTDIPRAVSKATASERERFRPLADRKVKSVDVSIGGEWKLSDALTFGCSRQGFDVTIDSGVGDGRQEVPGGKASLKIYIPDGQGSYLTYEYVFDYTPVGTEGFAPTDQSGWFLRERWGRGRLSLLGESSWRFRLVPHGTFGSTYPEIVPHYCFRWNPNGRGWKVILNFSWCSALGFWPAIKGGVRDRWYLSMDALPGVAPVACRLDFAYGREENFALLASKINCWEVTRRAEAQLKAVNTAYHMWYEDRLYGFAHLSKPTYDRFDAESGELFWKRMVEPMIEANRDLREITDAPNFDDAARAKFAKESEAVQVSVCKALGKMFNLSERASAARRDYLLMRFDGKLPPEPKPLRRAESALEAKAPDLDRDAELIELDDKEF